MFREVRKKSNAISIDAAKELLGTARRGVFAVNGDDGYPYAIPVNYLYDDASNRIIFHGAKSGHKVDALNSSSKVCFTVTGEPVIKDLEWAPYLRSVVVFGKCRMVETLEENLELVKKFAMKFYPNEKMVDDEVAASGPAVQMFVIDIEHITGKQVQES